MIAKRLRDKLSEVRMLAVDVDGVLTDGTLYYGPQGETIKAFHVRDGMGIRMLLERGIGFAVITGRRCEALDKRLADLGVQYYYPDCKDKRRALQDLLEKTSMEAHQVAFLGDDVADLPVMECAGVAIAVRDADLRVCDQADWITNLCGGRGAVREVCDTILTSRGAWQETTTNVPSGDNEVPFAVVIPSRYASIRLPGKPLRKLCGRPLVAHVWDRGIESGQAR